MSNKKSGVRKNLIVEKKADKCFSSWIWYALGALLLLAVLFFLYNGITGNAIRSFSFSDIQNAGHQLSPVIQFFLGGEYNGDYLFERVLFFLLILSLVFMVLKSMPLFKDDIGSSSKKIVILLSIIVSILSIRFINYEWLLTIFTTYSVLGATLMSILPFIIYYFFLVNVASTHSLVRKVGWVLFAGIYFGLYFSTADNYYSQVYMWTGLAAFLFIFIEEYITRAWKKERLRFGASMDAAGKIAAIDAQIRDINASALSPDQKKKSIDYLYKQRQFWERYLA